MHAHSTDVEARVIPSWIVQKADDLISIEDDAALIAALKTAIPKSDECLAHLDLLSDQLAPLAQRSDEVRAALANAVEALCDARGEGAERAALLSARKKMRSKYEYDPLSWNIVEMKKLDSDGDETGGDGEETGETEVPLPVSTEIRFKARIKKHDEASFGLLVSVKGLNGVWREHVMHRAEMMGEGEKWLKPLTAMGLTVSVPINNFRNLLLAVNPAMEIVTIDRPGWFDCDGGGKGFMLPSGAIVSASGDIEYRFTGDPKMGSKFKQAGTLEEWKLNVAAPAEKNSRLMLAICASFAGQLLEPLGIEGGGFHLYGSSSIGKTTALAVGASVFGHGSEFVENFRSTDNALENKCAARHHSCLLLDEIGQAKGDLGEIVYLIANGTAKGRMTAGGESRAEKRWSLTFLSTGEMATEEKIAADKKSKATAGHAVRAVDIEADAKAGHGLFDDLCGEADGRALSDKLKKATGAYYGTAGPAFVTWLVSNRETVETMRGKVDELASLFVANGCNGEADGQVHRVAARFALLAVAGELGREARVADWANGATIRTMFKLFCGWIKARGTSGDLEVNRGLKALQLNLSKYGMTKFDQGGATTQFNIGKAASLSDDSVLQTAARVESWGHREQDHQSVTYFVLRDMFSEICGNHAPKKVLAALAERGNLTPGEKGRYTIKRKFNGVRLPYYAITIDSHGFDNDGVWGEDDNIVSTSDMTWIDGHMIDVTPRTLGQLSA